MNAPDAGVTAGLATIPLTDISPSATNPRKHFDETAMAELVASVQAHGIIQPILVRPVTGAGFELVAGERRYRAAKAAKLKTIPAIVRELTDLQALELQVVENLKRADLHPLEEAEGYERLMNAHGMTADQVGDKIGKSKAYVYARLKLTALCSECRDAFYAGRLNPSTALLVARIPGAKLQWQATKEITEPDYRGEPLSVRTAAEHIQRNYMLRLDQAPFSTSDADLVKKAGACTTCPKRAGNQPELFGDVEHADTCTDTTCFAAKRLAHWAKVRGAFEARGIKVFVGKEAKEIKPSQYGSLKAGWTALDQPCYQDDKHRTYEKLVGKVLKDESIALLETNGGELVRIAKTKDVNAALKEKGIATPRDRSAEQPSEARTSRSGKEDNRENEAIEDRVADKVAKLVHDAPASAIAHEDLVLVAARLYHVGDEGLDLRLWWPELKEGLWLQQEQLLPRLAKLSAGDLGRFMVDIAFGALYRGWHENDHKLALELLTRRGIDVKKIEAEVRAELKAEAAAKAAEAPAPAKKKGKSK